VISGHRGAALAQISSADQREPRSFVTPRVISGHGPARLRTLLFR